MKGRLVGFLTVLLLLAACRQPDTAVPQLVPFASGLLNPVGLAEMPDGSILVAEEGTGESDLSAGVSLITPDGRVGRFITGLPSGRDSGDLSGVPFIQLSPDGRTLFTAHFGLGHLYMLPTPDTFTLDTPPYTVADLSERMVALNNVFLINPFDMTFSANGRPVVTDASGNGVAIETAAGQTRFFHRFGSIVTENYTIDPVPTGIARIDTEYYVTLTGGCPYPAGGGRLVAINDERHERIVADGLNMPIDVAQGPDGTIWVLEFARFRPDASCFSGMGYRANSGRLSRLLADGTLETVIDGLDFPGAVLPRRDGSLLISQVFDGSIVEVRWPERRGLIDLFRSSNRSTTIGDASPETDGAGPNISVPAPPAVTRRTISDPDAVLRAVIEQLELQPYPGHDLREGDTDLANLGQQLFFDPILSGDQNISCATCHHPALAMGDGRPLPIGTGGAGLGLARQFEETVSLGPEATAAAETIPNPFLGVFVPRNSPTIINSALLSRQFWDGRVDGYEGEVVATQEEVVNERQLTDPLATQALFPITSPHEMAGATLGHLAPETIRRELMARLVVIPAYAEQFTTLFGTPEPDITAVAEALAAFQRRLIFTSTPWDDYIAGDERALDAQQKRGALLFYGQSNPAVNCAACHSGDLFTDEDFHNLLVPQLGPGKGHGPDGRDDWGRAGVTFDARDRFRFRTPPLRNVALTTPYFHSGAYATLEDTIRHHAAILAEAEGYDPGQHLPPAHYSSVRPLQAADQLRTVAPLLAGGLPLTEAEIADLVAFLNALTDPAAANLSDFILYRSLSGLPVDPLPDPAALAAYTPEGESAAEVTPANGVPSPTGIRFVDVAADVGLAFRHGAFRRPVFDDPVAMMGGGLCWIDFDNDGWLDLYLVNSHAAAEADYWAGQGGLPANALFRNERGSFVDVSAVSGTDLAVRGNGCVAADFDRDGWSDLFVTADGANLLLWNQGDGTFIEGGEAAGVAALEWNSATAVADLNDDGWPDLFVAAFIDLENKIPRPSGAFPQDYYGLPDRVYLNNGDGTFSDVTAAVGLEREERGLGALFSDLDNDGALELYIANDGQPNRLYTAVPDSSAIGFHFQDLSRTADVGDSGSGMGIAGGDYDGDGRFDLFVTNWEVELNALYRNEIDETGALTFRYSTYRIGISGLGNNMTGWGTHFADFDHDGDEDLLVLNGHVPISNFAADAQLARFYGNLSIEGRPGQFREWTLPVGLHEEGVGPLLARGSAAADFDNDGDLDVAVNTIGGPPVLLRNEGGGGNWLQIGFDGFYPGAVVEVLLPDGRLLVREWQVGSSYLASEDPRLHVGLGAYTKAAQVTVHWNGRSWQQTDVPVNQLIILP